MRLSTQRLLATEEGGAKALVQADPMPQHRRCALVPRRLGESQEIGGHARNRTGVHRFAVCCVTTPPRGLNVRLAVYHAAFRRGNAAAGRFAADLRRLAAEDTPRNAGSASADWLRFRAAS
jgi:hypothetical protein